jgi:thioredoxin reductase
MKTYDVAVIGGSVAGLQAALTLARARRTVLLFDDATPRNRAAAHVHNYLGVEDPSPAELVAIGRRQVQQYGVEVHDTRVDDVSLDDGFLVGDCRFRAVVLATGLRDELPDVPGVADGWGRSVVACPHCHGWEVRDQPLVQLGMRGLPDRSVARALLLSRWTNEVLLCRAERLGCGIVDGAAATDDSGRTSIPGVYAVGTTAVPTLFAIGAAGHASTTAVALHADLLEQEL